MKSSKFNPAFFIALCLSIVFLVSAPLFLPGKLADRNLPVPGSMENEGWTGIISFWYVPSVETGRGSQVQWLNRYIRSFEKQHPGVFIDMRIMTVERMAMYFSGAPDPVLLPELITLGFYEQYVPYDMLLDLKPYFKDDELSAVRKPALDSVMLEERLIGVPWMMGAYGLYVSNSLKAEQDLTSWEDLEHLDALNKMANAMSYEKKAGRKTIKYYGFCTYTTPSSRPLLSIIYNNEGKIINNKGYGLIAEWYKIGNICPPNMTSFSYQQAFGLFAIEKRAGIMLGSTRVLYDLRKLTESGKGIDYSVYPVPTEGHDGVYHDQIAAIGILKKTPDEIRALCIEFLKGLLDVEHQQTLDELGMYSVLQSLRLYSDDDDMKALESSLDRITVMPAGSSRDDVNKFWADFQSMLKVMQ
ncbi:MAG TPA: extracellular solute-binding protein [Candidatus Atribacteria bacterium]|nr:extracellular solute-binding protein [Candidatus Atribacteria bacterium]